MPLSDLDIPTSEPSPVESPKPDVLTSAPKGLRSKARQLPQNRRNFGDTAAIRSLVYDNVLNQAANIAPIENARYRLSLHDLEYSDPPHFSLQQQKEAILGNKTLYRRLKGTWKLTDKATEQPVDEKRMTIAQVPHMNERGTFILDGTETTLAHQMRLLPGMYTRIKANNEVEAHANVIPGKGVSHRYFFEPETGVFKINVGQSKVPLMPVLRAFGVTDKQMRDAWGSELFAVNQKHDSPHVIDKLYERMVRKADPNAPSETKREGLIRELQRMEFDPNVTKRTLGKPHKSLTADAILDTTKKLLAVNKREQDPDDRDHLAFQRLMGPEDLISERVGMDHATLQKLLWASTFRGNLEHIQPGAFTKSILAAFRTSGLGQAAEEVNAAELIDHQGKITRLGEGGIGDAQSIPEESRSVHTSQMSFIDPVKTAESGKVGVDLRTAFGVQKGTDGQMYAPFADAKTGKRVYKSPQELADLNIIFPGEWGSNKPMVAAIAKGKMQYIPRHDAHVIMESMESGFSPLSNMIPMKSTVKGQRVSMGARMLTQALPLVNAEAPFVQSKAPIPGDISFEQLYGQAMGTVRANQGFGGTVTAVTPNSIDVKLDNGTKHSYELYHNMPYNRKTFIHNKPLVKPGQRFEDGDFLASSNYTSDDLTAALGMNARVAYLPFKGLNYEDAAVISESMAKRFTSEHMYQHNADFSANTHRGKKAFISLFPTTYDKKILETLDDKGVVKPGTVVEFGHPLVLMANEKERAHNQVHRSSKGSFTDSTITWDHHSPGIVTDVANSKNGALVAVKSYVPMRIGDKLCYDDKTDVLTLCGWRPIKDVTLTDEIATLNDKHEIEYLAPVAVRCYPHSGRMYNLETTQVSLCVTDNHKLYAKRRGANDYELIEAQEIYGKRYKLKKSGVWIGRSPGEIVLPRRIDRRGSILPPKTLSVKAYLTLMGMYLSEGNLVFHPKSGSYGIDITQIKQPNRSQLLQTLTDLNIAHSVNKEKARIYGLQLYHHFREFGKGAANKRIPNEIFSWAKEDLAILYKWLMWGDGSEKGTGHSYCTISRQLADDVQRLAFHLGMSANIRITPPKVAMVRGQMCNCAQRYDVYIYRKKNHPEINHGHIKRQHGQSELWTNYDGYVYCVTLPKNHVLYIRRNDKTVWSGNSGRVGDKGIVSDIVPDEQMPHGEDGKPFEILVSPAGLISRINAAQVIEAGLGKIAAKTGKPYKIEDFNSNVNLTQYALDELKKHGMSDLETVTDPETGRRIPNVLAGNRFFMKLHHVSESKSQGRGAGGGYTTEGTPAKGGESGSKKVSLADSNALLAHGALNVIHDAHVVRGQRNEEYWLRFQRGQTPPNPQVPFIYDKFVNELKASGINVVREGTKQHIMALTNKDVKKLTEGRELQNTNTVDWKEGLKPMKGGLFDAGLTGGHNGKLWTQISLHEPMPNPVMEEPIRRMLDLTEANFLSVLAGKKDLNGMTGPGAISKALGDIDTTKEIAKAKAAIASGKKSYRDAAIRKLGYLEAAERLKIHPKDWMLDSVPVLPPAFRPVSVMAGGKFQIIADPNHLYREVWDANQNLKELHGKIDDVSEERLNLYNAFKGVTGLGDPIQPKNKERDVKGVLRHVFGTSPKFSEVQFKLLGADVNLVGRGAVTPNPDFDMDSIGIPEGRAWDVYKPFVIRGLVRAGMPGTVALKAVQDQTKQARTELVKAMSERPVLVNRYPILHRYGLMAFWPKLVQGNPIQVNPIITKAMGMDFDGDTAQYHVPVTPEAVKDAREKMLPSTNLFAGATFKAHYLPNQEFVQGLHAASAMKDTGRPKVFATRKDAIKAYKRGDINLGTPVEILEK